MGKVKTPKVVQACKITIIFDEVDNCKILIVFRGVVPKCYHFINLD